MTSRGRFVTWPTRRQRPTALRRRAVGAEIVGGGVDFRVWAPHHHRVEVVLDEIGPVPLDAEPCGYWRVLVCGIGAGARYSFRLDGEKTLYPDPASRFQPDGPHGSSEVIDPRSFIWSDGGWSGLRLHGQVFYELHLGTFCREGTWEGARQRLPALRDLGVTAIEIMPVADFPGAFGWGYDGVDLYAPYHGYGRPDDFRRFVNEAHGLDVGVILDVVYNHLGPDGNYLKAFAPAYFAKQTEWGEGINYDGVDAHGPRTFVSENAATWIDEFHLDGLRLDATQTIYDESTDHILAEIGRHARAAAGGRDIVIVAENEKQQTRLARPLVQGGCGLNALWNDDFHHSAMVALTGRNEAYYMDYQGTAQELLSALKHGYLYQGQRYAWQKQRRGTPTRGLAPETFVAFTENHDQVANWWRGERLWRLSDPGRHRAMTGLLLLGPWTPLLFAGQEWNATAPWMFFADHNGALAPLVRKGRTDFLSQFPSCATAEARAQIADPGAAETFERCRLDWAEREREPHAQALALHRDLLSLRRTDPVIAAQAQGDVSVDGAVLGSECFVVRFFAADNDDRLLIMNLGRDRHLSPAPEPLLAPPDGARWGLLWSSEDPRYGGSGTPDPEPEEHGWQIPGHAALLLGRRRA